MSASAERDAGEVPSGSAGVEQGADPATSGTRGPVTGYALEPLDQVVRALDRPVRHACTVPRRDLRGPADDGPSELAKFGRDRSRLAGRGRAGRRTPQRRRGGRSRRRRACALSAFNAIRTSRRGSPASRCPNIWYGHGRRGIRPWSAAVGSGRANRPCGLGVSPSNLVESLFVEIHQLERISNLTSPGQHGVERQPPRPRQVQHDPPNRLEPFPTLWGEPTTQAA